MKKILIALFVIAAVALSVSGYGFDLNVKKKSCEAACDKAHEECMEKAKEENEKTKDEVKSKASELACSQAKDKCYTKCR